MFDIKAIACVEYVYFKGKAYYISRLKKRKKKRKSM